MSDFDDILRRAAELKGGEQNLLADLPKVPTARKTAGQPDSYFLSLMTMTIFQAGFVWQIIRHKWRGFEEAFYLFDPERLHSLPDEAWEAYAADERIVRNMRKVYAVRHNVGFVMEIRDQYGGFGKFLTKWKPGDQTGLLGFFKQRASRLGGMTGQYFLRRAGWDGFILTPDVMTCLTERGLLTGKPASQKTLREAQELFNTWHTETGLPYTHLSLIAAKSVG